MDSNKSKKVKINGSRRDVYYGRAQKTRHGLTKKDLYKNARGKIVSLKKRKMARQVKYNPLMAKKLLVPKGSKKFGLEQMKNVRLNKKTKKSGINKFFDIFK